MSDRPSAMRPESDIYTVLAVLATVFLFVRSQQLFGTWNPFTKA